MALLSVTQSYNKTLCAWLLQKMALSRMEKKINESPEFKMEKLAFLRERESSLADKNGTQGPKGGGC